MDKVPGGHFRALSLKSEKMNSTLKTLAAAAAFALAAQVQLPAQDWSMNSVDGNVKWEVTPAESYIDVQLPDRNTGEWVEAPVPGTVFTAYVNAGKEKDPNFGDNIYHVDRSKYDRPYWYRTEFMVPGNLDKDYVWLNFRGINRKGKIYLNGEYLGELDGFMHRGMFDVTDILRRDSGNELVVLVDIPRGSLGNNASPTYICSAGWDWMPYVPGLNSGITDKVYLSTSDALTISDPWIRTSMPSTARADLSIELEVSNAAEHSVSGEVTGVIMPGNITFSTEFNAEPYRKTKLYFDKENVPALSIDNPRLWWPNGYGDPDMYTCTLTLKTDAGVSDTKTVDFGIRDYDYTFENGVFHLWINGKRVFVKGADWGMAEYMLRCSDEEFFTKVKFHDDMNFNMIRNWLGVTTADAFYQACDKYGIMVWDDFWINSNPNLPDDVFAFNFNAVEKIKRVRNHPSIAVWCGDNEGFPEPPLDNWLRENVRVYDGGDRYYQSNSHEGNLSGSGPWGAFEPRYYFNWYPYPYNMVGTPGWGFRTEIGTAVFVNAESFRKFIPEDRLWPRNEMWNTHYFGQMAFNGLPDQYEKLLEERYGKSDNIDEFCRKAQLLNIESNQAMFEGWLYHMWEDASGIMTWMGQSAYPSMVWQTYDYYYDLTGAYWGCKRACSPLHLIWNPINNDIKLTNTTSEDYDGLKVSAEVFNMDGKTVDKFTRSVTVSSASNTALRCFTLPFYDNGRNLAASMKAVVSSSGSGSAADLTDGSEYTRWGSDYTDDQWVCIDLGKRMNVYGVGLLWEAAFGREFKILVSDDAGSWTEVYHEKNGKGGRQELYFDDTECRYVKLQGIRRGTGYGYSLWEMKVFGGDISEKILDDVHFIRLTLEDRDGNVLDANTYWRGLKRNDFTALNALAAPQLKVQRKDRTENGEYCLEVKVTNSRSSSSVSFGTWIQLHDAVTGERVLPAFYEDNYFILKPGESRTVEIRFDASLISEGTEPDISVSAYNGSI